MSTAPVSTAPLDRYRGRAGQPQDVQRGDYLAMKATGGHTLADLT